MLADFIAQHYLGRAVPREILVSHLPSDVDVLQQALSTQAGRKVAIRSRLRSDRARWMKLALQNAELALKSRLTSKAGAHARNEALARALELESPPTRMECFDISHTSGDKTVASCVVFNEQGPLKSDSRRFNVDGISAGDDYAAMQQALQRRYRRLKAGEARLPDILFIDGGKGQLAAAAEVLEDLDISGILLLGVAKGAGRRPGMERLFLLGREQPLILPEHSPALHLVQQIRDEAHRFAVTGHRQRRNKGGSRSTLEGIPGIGPKRRQRLLTQFGGLQGVARAGVEDIATVEGVSSKLAEQIYQTFHGND